MKILKVDKESENKVLEFINEAINLNDIDINIVRNASYVIENDKIIGVLSYERFTNIALIRYFIFKEKVSLGLVIALLENVKKSAKEENITFLLTIVTEENIKKIFEELGFVNIKASDVYIDETSFLNSKYKNAQILKCVLWSGKNVNYTTFFILSYLL